ncbi:alpha-glucosidase/alpha-galactosidase [Microbacterium gorillae]|uniref:alpha-glucosidase/alpha-galactosidase n=1 Tax=Microbacterium gorillae TaxID=1231063 RepID=UPI00058C1852|nr:alpha-glucosidase/alpha-galactosidase [Microbacterium gorillae]
MSKIAFTGAGSVVFTRQLLTDLLRFPDLPEVEIALHDTDPDRLDVAGRTADNVATQLGRKVRIHSFLDRRAAFEGADFVVNMVQVGGIDATRVDLEVPASYGLRQTIGDTTGVGGVFRGLRTFPVLTGIAEDMRAVCPDALLLNYTNPMAMNIWWLSVVAPDIRAYGLCHSVYWTVNDLCELIGVPLEGTDYVAAGVNHQSWLTRWERDGEDLYPRLRAKIASDPELERRVRVEIFRRIGYYPTETSEHSAEYLDWFLRSDEQIERFRLQPSEYLGISEENVAEFHEAHRILDAGGNVPLHDPSDAAEYAPQIIHAMLTGQPRRIFVNVPNRGLITNLPEGAVVEVPADVDATGVHPLPYGEVPLAGAALNRRYLSVAELTIEAARTGDPELIRRAVLVDPNAASSITPDQIWAMCDEMTRRHARYLPVALGGDLVDQP